MDRGSLSLALGPPTPEVFSLRSPRERSGGDQPDRDLWILRESPQLPPHLEISPIAATTAPPSRFLNLSSTLLVYGLIGFAVFGLVNIRHESIGIPSQVQTVSVILEHESTAGPSEVPAPKSAGGGMPGAGRTTDQPALQNSLPQPLTGLSVDEMPLPQLDVPQETNLLPTRPLILSGGRGGGGTAGSGPSEGHAVGFRTGWGESGLLSGNKRGLTVTLDTLEVLHQEVPKYPEAARAEGLSGDVIVDVTIDELGIPTEIEILQTPHKVFLPEVLRVTRKWRFTPVVFSGRKVRANFRICFRFIIETT